MAEGVGIVVVGYESEDEWPDFFSSLEASTYRPQQIVVVDNSPVPSLPAAPSRLIPTITHHDPSNRGYGAAANQGVAMLDPEIDWVVICNPDTRLQRDTLETLMAERNALPETAVLGPRLVTSGGETYPSARAIPGIRIGIGHALLYASWPTNPWSTAYLGDYEGTEPRSVGWLSGAFLLVDRGIFLSVGGFDERFFMFFEDVDLGMRVKRAGKRNVYVPGAAITHSGAASTAGHHRAMVRAHHRSAELFLAKLYPQRFQWPLRVVLTLGLRFRSWILTR